MKTTEKILTRAEKIQSDCHDTISQLKKAGSNAEYQDLTNAYLFKKLAEFEVRIEELTKKPKPYDRIYFHQRAA